jgi:hypothetical protein
VQCRYSQLSPSFVDRYKYKSGFAIQQSLYLSGRPSNDIAYGKNQIILCVSPSHFFYSSSSYLFPSFPFFSLCDAAQTRKSFLIVSMVTVFCKWRWRRSYNSGSCTRQFVIINCKKLKICISILILDWCILLRLCFNENHKSITFVCNLSCLYCTQTTLHVSAMPSSE